MSYDIWLTADVGGKEPATLDVLPHWNYTSNVAPMWRKAMPESDGLAGLEGMEAGEAAEHLHRGITRMESDPDAYRALNPENGWGDYEGQLEALRRLWEACVAAPLARVAILPMTSAERP